MDNAKAMSSSADLESVLATLALNQSKPTGNKLRTLSGAERAAVLMLALGDEFGGKVWALLDDDELRQISIIMSTIGMIEATSVENLLLEFVSRLSASGAVIGSFEATERLLRKYLPPERVSNVMEEVRGPAGRTMWEKLSNVPEEVLANYLKNEYPQTVAVMISKLRRTGRARACDLAGRSLARRHQPHAEDGGDSKGSSRSCRANVAQRFHEQPFANAPARRLRGHGRDLQRLRPPDRNTFHRGVGLNQPRRRRTHQSPDVHL
jgi:hypothetical protein